MTAKVGKKCIAIPDYESDGYIYADGYIPEVGELVMAYPLSGGRYVALPLPVVQIGDILPLTPMPGFSVPYGEYEYGSGDYWLDYVVSYSIGSGGDSGSISNILGSNLDTYTVLGEYGWVKARFSAPLREADFITVYEMTNYLFSKTFNPTEIENHTYPNPAARWNPTEVDGYWIQFYEPNIIYIKTDSGGSGWGNICGAAISIN